ncbi:SDR family oxidoreductase [Salicibibacter cibarius]|uniref:SDR family oxidoreductase n=1 Tax=Salicibibacter cibarius TaxID=2743000 RepID=A0A7T6Z6N0_9BACI|nr:SDR family NAD(P)-dependent oxidoreductase [Salicibibacter cibarius]QQK77781.1 SDR family oxidoreductase [Salicibibacter cibarius]
MKLNGKIALITGAGSGMGKSSAFLFAKEGAKVVVNDFDEDKGKETVEKISANGGEAIFIKADVSKSIEVEQMVETTVDYFGRIDILFNNAGIACVGPLHETKENEWDNLIDVNVKGVFLVTKYVIPLMMKQNEGSIINMSSGIAEMGLASRAAYAASKGAVLALTKSTQVDYASYNIRINAILPGTIQTPFIENYLEDAYGNVNKGLDSLKKRQLNEKLGQPEDIAQVALLLASDESRFMMGSPVYVDGGAVFCKT